MNRHIRAIQLATAAAVGVATVLIAALPSLDFAYRSPDGHVAFETVASFASVLAAFILFGRFRNSGTRSELMLGGALTMLAIANVVAALAPAFSGSEDERATVWLPLTAIVIAAGALAVAAWSRGGSPATPRDLWRLAWAGAATGGLLVGVALLAPGLPTGLGTALAATATGRPEIAGTPGLVVMQALVIGLFAAAAAGFTRKALRSRDELLGWLATATLLAAFARLHYLLFPSIYSEYVFTGDFLRLAAYLAILVAALRQIAVYQRLSAKVAVAEERGRISRDLHDGFAQDASFIALTARRLADREPAAAAIATAAEQALHSSRAAILELHDDQEPLSVAIASVAATLTGRQGVHLSLRLDESVEVTPEAHNALTRVTSEAISNSIRHGRASSIEIELRSDADAGATLSICDDGDGFSTAALGGERPRGRGGLGLEGMRRRLDRLGGRLSIDSEAGRGTEITVVVPSAPLARGRAEYLRGILGRRTGGGTVDSAADGGEGSQP